MKGKYYFLVSLLLLLSREASAQYKPWWPWAVTDSAVTSSYSQTEHVLAAKNNKAFWGRLKNNKRVAGTLVEGDYSLSEYDSSGKLLNSSSITGKLHLLDAQADASGNWYVLGQFYDSLRFAGQTPIVRSTAGGAVDPDYFIARLEGGTIALGWIQMIGHTNQSHAAAFTIANNQLYLAVDSVTETQVWSLSLQNGNHTTLLHQTGTSTASSIQVDAGGNIYLAGSCGYSGIRFGTVQQNPVPGNSYPSYIVRYHANGTHHWHYWMYDVNCVSRKLTIATNNIIYYSGDLHDSMKIGAVVLQRPIPAHDYVAARLDSNGTVAWARQMDGSGGEAMIGNAYHAVVTPDSALVLFAQTNQYVNWSSSVGTDAFNTNAATVVSIGPDGQARWAKIVLGQITTNQHIATDGVAVWVTGNGYTNTNFFLFDTTRLYVRPQTYVPYLGKIKLTPAPPPVVSGIPGIHQLPVYIAPNPAHTTLGISGPGLLQGPATVSLMDMTGKVLLHRVLNVSGSQAYLDVSAIPRGIFFLEIRSGDSRCVAQVVLE